MNISESFEEIIKYAHFWNWAPDWDIAQKVYEAFPMSFSVLLPFAYSYLEELIRSTTSEYGMVLKDANGNPKMRTVGFRLIQLAINENKPNNQEYTSIFEEIKSYFSSSQQTADGDNRHTVAHGFLHPRFWDQESFEKLIGDIARLSKHAGF